MEMVISRFLHADMSRSRVLGETREEQDALIDLALGRLQTDLKTSIPEEGAAGGGGGGGGGWRRQADVALIDQNLHDDVLGTSIAAELRQQGFCNVICIMTADSGDAVDALLAHPAVDCAFQKGTNTHTVVETVLKQLAIRRKGGAP
jgi:hypothetical protein